MAKEMETLEFTPRGIPTSLRPFFQEYVLEELDPERDAFTVISRTMAWGEFAELRWLFRRFGAERLAAWVRKAGWRLLPRRRLKYWLVFFNITEYERGERVWMH